MFQVHDKLVVKPFSYETNAPKSLTIQHLTLRSATPTGNSNLVSSIFADVHVYKTLACSCYDGHKTSRPLMGEPTLCNVNSLMIMEVNLKIL